MASTIIWQRGSVPSAAGPSQPVSGITRSRACALSRADALDLVCDMLTLWTCEEISALFAMFGGIAASSRAVVLSMLRQQGQVELARKLQLGRADG